jgi:hypothetical protein
MKPARAMQHPGHGSFLFVSLRFFSQEDTMKLGIIRAER